MTKTDEQTNRFTTVANRKINHEGRIGYTWRLFPEEAKALDAAIAKAGYTDRTSWFREEVLGLPPHERKTAPKKEKPAKKAKKEKPAKKAKKTGARTSKADIGPAPEAA